MSDSSTPPGSSSSPPADLPSTPTIVPEPQKLSRWRILVVRLEPGDQVAKDIQAVLDDSHVIRSKDLPLVVRSTTDHQFAEQTITKIRTAGGVALLIEEPIDASRSAFCENHPSRIAGWACKTCEMEICRVCDSLSGYRGLCTTCHTQSDTIRRTYRVRNLFAIFVFFAFLYLLVESFQTDLARTDPTGPVSVAILQFSPNGRLGSPVIRALNGQTDDENHSLHQISSWFNQERARYRLSNRDYLRVSVRGPWGTQINPPLLDRPGRPAWELLIQSWKYSRYFQGLASDFGIELDRYAVKIFVVYADKKGDVPAASRSSERGRLGIAYVSVKETNPAYALVTIAHEMAHTLGATDTYDPATRQAMHPEGFVEPFSNPLYPQRFAELMAVDLPVGPNNEREITDLNEVRIGHQTASQMGWIGPEQAKLFYTPPANSPEDLLQPKTKSKSELPEGDTSAPTMSQNELSMPIKPVPNDE